MDNSRNPNYGRRGGASGGRGRGGGRSGGQDYQNQGGGRGRHGMNRGSHNQPEEWAHRAPTGGNQPPGQQAWGYRPPQVRPPPQQRAGAAAGSTTAWTGRPWGPSPQTPPSPAQPVPRSQMHHQRSPADELPLTNLRISDPKSLSSASDGKAGQIVAIRRPDRGGTLAVRSIGLLVNHYPVNFEPNQTIFHYDVDVKPKRSDGQIAQRKMRKSDMRLIREKLFSDNPLVKGLMNVYDGEKNIFSPYPLPEGEFTVDIMEGEDIKSGSYTFTIKLVNELKLSKLKEYLRGNLSDIPRAILQGMDLVMKENPSRKRISVGRWFYSCHDGENLDSGIAAYRGFQQSLKPTLQGVVLCLDSSIMAFRKPLPVIQFLEEHLHCFELYDIHRRRNEVNEVLRGLRVRVTHRLTKQKYTIAGLTEENACDVQFLLVDREGINPPQETMLLAYFKDKWDVEVEHKKIPCLELGKKDKSNKVPLEFCVLVEGQRYPKEYLDKNAGVFLKHLSLVKAFERMDKINEMVQSEDGPCGGDVASAFGIEVDTHMTQVAGRILAAPQLKLRDSMVRVDRENCQWNLTGGKYLVDGKSVECWGLLEFVDHGRRRYDDGRQAKDFVDSLMRRSRSLGMNMAEPLSHRVADMRDFSSAEKLENLLRDVIRQSGKGKLELVLCAMTKRDPGYKNLKWVAETRVGVVTQCYLSPNAANKSRQDQYLANLCLKINAKLGGNNFELGGKLLNLNCDEHVMFIGADVNHPAPMNTSCPSISAVVGTVNWPAANRYVARVLPQAHRKEQIVNFGSMCMDLVDTYKQLNQVRPKRIVIFRDGVSEGQFEMVLGEELHDLRKTFSDSNYSPKVTLIIAQKRHSTRLFVEHPRDGGRSGNVPPGTVVDTKIVHPLDFDFYLCSHYGALGTSKPTHYYVLYDENSFTSDQLQKLIYESCFTFARCTKPVSLVPPVYYADLAAYRGRMFQEAVMERQSSSRAYASAASRAPSDAFDTSFYKMHPDMKNSMFFI